MLVGLQASKDASAPATLPRSGPGFRVQVPDDRAGNQDIVAHQQALIGAAYCYPDTTRADGWRAA